MVVDVPCHVGVGPRGGNLRDEGTPDPPSTATRSMRRSASATSRAGNPRRARDVLAQLPGRRAVRSGFPASRTRSPPV